VPVRTLTRCQSRRRLLLALAALFAATSGAGCRPVHEDLTRGSAAGGPIAVAVRSLPGNLDPLRAAGPAAREVTSLLWPGLAVLEPATGEVVPGLAQGWRWSPDGTVLTVTVASGARWSDGSPVTATDAAASLAAAQRAAPPSEGPSRLRSLGVRDDRTLVLRLQHADCRVLDELTTGLVPAAYARASGASGDGPRIPPTSGALAVHGWQPGAELRLAPLAKPGAPTGRELVLRAVPSASAALAAVFAGKADLATVDAKDAAHVAGKIAAGFPGRIARLPGTDLVFVALNLAQPILGDVTVRRALGSAIDYDRVMAAATYGEATRVPADVPPGTAWAYASDLTPTATDLAAARSALTAAGWRHAEAGGVRQRLGQPLRLRLLVSRGNEAEERAAAAVAESLGVAGVDVVVHPVDYGQLLQAVVGQRFDMALMAWHDLPADPDPGDRWSAAGDRPGEGPNFTSVADADLDRLLAQARRAPSCLTPQRSAAYRAAQARLQELAPILPLYSPNRLYLLGPRLDGVPMGSWSPYAWLLDVSGSWQATAALPETGTPQSPDR
jgi:peptide/nickel transport system substrate-binding protein